MINKILITGLIAIMFGLSLSFAKDYWVSGNLLHALLAGLAFQMGLFFNHVYNHKFPL